MQRAVADDFWESTTRTDLQHLIESVEHRDSVAAAREAHRIKGASMMVGAHSLASGAEKLEALLRNGEWSAVPAAVAPMHEALARLTRESTIAEALLHPK